MTVAVDGAQRYVWPVSTGRPGYDTPNGTFKPNRMDADHLSQEWDNAPMPHTMFFDLHGHAIHGFFDVKHLGLAVSHGCVRLSPDHATMLFDLVKAEGMANTSVIVAGRTPGGDNGPVARAHLPENETVYSPQPMSIAPQPATASNRPPGYGQQAARLRPAAHAQRYYSQAQPGYAPNSCPPSRRRPATAQPQPYYGQPGLRAALLRPAVLSAQPQPYYGQQQYYGQPQPY